MNISNILPQNPNNNVSIRQRRDKLNFELRKERTTKLLEAKRLGFIKDSTKKMTITEIEQLYNDLEAILQDISNVQVKNISRRLVI